MVKILNLAKQVEYVPESDRELDESEKTVFILGGIDSRVMAHLADATNAMVVQGSSREGASMQTVTKANATAFELVQLGVRGWRKLVDDEGKEVPYKTVDKVIIGKTYQSVEADIIAKFPLDLINELADEINRINSLSEQERKNSDKSSSL